MGYASRPPKRFALSALAARAGCALTNTYDQHLRPLKLGDYVVVLEPQRDPILWDHYLVRNCGLNMVSNYMVTILGLTFSVPGVIKMTITKKILTK